MPPAVIAGVLSGAAGAALAGTSIVIGAAVGGGLAAINYALAPKPKKYVPVPFEPYELSPLETGNPTRISQLFPAIFDTAAGLVSPPSPVQQAYVRPVQRRTVVSAVSPARWIVGRARVAGAMVFYKETSKNDLHIAMILSEGACDSIERIWVNGEEITFSRSGTQLSATGGHAGKLTVHEYFRADGTQGASLRAAVGSEWTTDHKLNGVSWVHVHLRQPNYGNSKNRFWSSFPDINFLVRGIKIAWPGEATPVWTESAAAIRYWWLRTRRGIPENAIDAASVRAAHSLCAESVTVNLPAGYKDYSAISQRYAVNGVIHSTDDAEQTEAEFDFAWQGWAVEVAGMYNFQPGATRPITRALIPDDIIRIEGIQPGPALQDRMNAAQINLVQSREHDWLEASIPELNDTAAETRDGERLLRDLGSRPFVADPIAAGRLLAIFLRRARATATFTYRLKPGINLEWLGINPGDWITVTDPEHGLADFQAVVTRMEINPDWSVTLDLIEQPNGIYASTLHLPGLKPRAIDIPSRRIVPSVTGLAAVHGFKVSRDGTVIWHIDVSWDDAPYNTRIRVFDENSSLQTEVSADGTMHRFVVDGPGTYTISAYYVTLDGFGSPTVDIMITFDWSAVPVPSPVVISSEQYGSLIQIVAAPIVNRDVAGIELRYRFGPIGGSGALSVIDDAGWLAAPRADVALVAPISGNQPLVANALLPATGRYRFFVRLFNRVGNYGPIVDIGYKRIVVPAIETIGQQSWPLWMGTLNNLFLWPHDEKFHLFPDYDDRDTLTLDRWNGQTGWPFGPVEGYGEALSDDSTWYETEITDLGEVSNVDIIVNVAFTLPPGPPPLAAETGHVIYVYHGLTNDRQAMTQITITAGAPTIINAVRYIAVRVHLSRWRGAALSRFVPEIRRLA